MTRILPTALIAILTCTAAQAEDRKLFGMDDPKLACSFVEEAQELAEIEENWRRPCNPNSTRSVYRFDEIGLLRDAYRTDPDATLDLIERILKAGGGT